MTTPISVVSIQPDLDLAGALDHGNREISWGELTHHGDEVVAWTGIFGPGYVYLPAGPYESFSPVATGTFSGPAIDSIPDASLAELEAHHVAGVSFPRLSDALRVFAGPARRPHQPHQAGPVCRAGSGSASPVSTARCRTYIQTLT